MSQTRSTLWSGSILVDSFPRPRWPWTVAVCAVALVLLLDATLLLALRAGDQGDAATLSNPRQVRSILSDAADTARHTDAPVWVLMGDSVLVGDSVRDEIPDWDRHRVIDYMRREACRDAPVRLFQTALNGMLPIDLLQLVRELDRQDPAGRAGVVIEVNLRYFSPYYAEQEACTRPWLEDLAPPVVQAGKADWSALALLEARHALEHVHDATPVLRHRDALAGLWNVHDTTPLLAPETDPAPVEPMAIHARVHEHFKTPVLRGAFAQLDAFREVLHRLAESGRPALLFTPPLSDEYIGDVTTPERYAEDLALVAEMVAAEGESVRLAHMDHPLFDRRMFKDIAHMYPAGNRLLALNLMHALNMPFAKPPAEEELIHAEGPDTALLWNINSGNMPGPPWQAALRAPQGIALRDGACIVADTGNHCLRVFDETRGTLRTLAGIPGTAGWRDGGAAEALLDQPVSPCILGESVYFIDDGGTRLRRLYHDRVMTEGPMTGPSWSGLRALRARRDLLYLLDGDDSILAYDPETMKTETVISDGPWQRIASFDIASDGRLFIADERGRIWLSDLALASRGEESFDLFFENTATQAIPEAGWFPFAFKEMRLNAIQDIRYVSRYNGLLVQDRFPESSRVRGFDERVHMRFIGLNDRRIYPWTMPLVSGAYTLWNQAAEAWVSPFRDGTLALSDTGSTIYYLERNRTRLFRMGDGLWSTAKVGQTGFRPEGDHAPDLMGPHIGAHTYYNHLPDRYLGDRVERTPRSGPYIGLMTGPSIISSSDVETNYSLARALEQRLQRDLGLGACARFDLIVRSEAGMRFDESVDIFTEFVDLGGRLDVVFFTLRNIFVLDEGTTPGEELERIARAAERFDTLVLFLDANPLFSRYKDSLRPANASYEESRGFVMAAGFEVIDPGNDLLRDALSYFPAGSPPFEVHHAAPWAIDKAAGVFAARILPALDAHIADRIPALKRLAPLLEEPEETLRLVIETFEENWGEMPTVTIPQHALQRRYASGHLDLLLDLNKTGAYRFGLPEAALQRIAWSTLRQSLRGDLAGRLATTVSLRLVTFANYDEYGEGVADSANTVLRLDLDTIDLEAFLDDHLENTAAAA